MTTPAMQAASIEMKGFGQLPMLPDAADTRRFSDNTRT